MSLLVGLYALLNRVPAWLIAFGMLCDTVLLSLGILAHAGAFHP